MTLLEAAHTYAQRGWRVIPLHRVGGTAKACSCSAGLSCKSAGKHPIHKDWQNEPRMSAADIEATWDSKTPPNIGIATGADSGFWVLDIDPDKGGADSAKRLVQEYGNMPATLIVKTGSGGYHYYFSMPDFEVTNRNKWFKDNGYPGIDVRGTGGQVVAAPSISSTGGYEIVVDTSPAPAPAWLLDAVRPVETDVTIDKPTQQDVGPLDERGQRYMESAWAGELRRLDAMREAATPDGQGYRGEPWDTTCYEVACSMIEIANTVGTPLEQTWEIFKDHAPTDTGFKADDLSRIFKSAMGKVGQQARQVPAKPAPSSDPLSSGYVNPSALAAPDPASTSGAASESTTSWSKYSWDDYGNAQRVVRLHGATLRWVPKQKAWARYENGTWLLSAAAGEAAVIDMVNRIWDLEHEFYSAVSADPQKKSQRQQFSDWVAKQRSATATRNAASTVKYSGVLDANTSDFDTHHLLLNVANGVIDLSNGQLLEHDPALLLAQSSSVVFDPEARAPRWEAFLERSLPDPEMRRYLQRIMGYSLTGLTIEQAMFIHHGETQNGKSVFLRIMEAVFGQYSQTVPSTTLLTKRFEQHPTDVSRMRGKRLLQASETAAGARMDEALVKRLTGQETVTARGMGEEFSDFSPTGKVHLVTNHLPHIGADPATQRRVRMVHWGVRIPVEERDPYLAERIIKEELSGVLNWVVAGTSEWQKHGLGVPITAVMDAEDYFQGEDEFGDWLNARTMHGSKTSWTPTEKLYLNYNAWCRDFNIKPMSKIAFARELSRRDIKTVRTKTSRGFQLVLTEQPWLTSHADPLES